MKQGKWASYGLIIFFIVLMNLIMLEFAFYEAIFPQIQARYALPPDFGELMLGVILFGGYIVIGGTGLLFGYLADKYNRILLTAIGMGAWAGLNIAIFLSPHWLPYMVFRIMLGMGQGAIMPIGYSLLMDVIKFKNRSKAFAVILLLQGIGPVFGIVFGLALGDVWQFVYLFFGFSALGFGLCCLFIKEPKRAATEEQFAELIEKGMSYSYRIKKEDLKYIIERPTNFWLIVNFVDTIVPGLLVGWLLYYLEIFAFRVAWGWGVGFISDLGLAYVIGTAAASLIIAAALAFIGTFYFAYLGDKKAGEGGGIRAKIATYCSILTIPFITIAFLPFIPFLSIPFGILMGLALFFEQGIGANWFATIMDINLPENRGTMIALALLADTIGRGVGGLIGGFFNYEVWGIVLLVVNIINAILWLPVLKYIRGDLKKIGKLQEERAMEMKSRQAA
ncbi:MAG: MFS transporter [Candidatus Helarchaeota archaeon]